MSRPFEPAAKTAAPNDTTRGTTMRRRFATLALIAAPIVVLSTAAGPAGAHHSFTMFDDTQQILIEGKVTAWHFTNPHTWLHVEAPNAEGEMQTWSFEGGAVVHAVRLGVTGRTFQPGETVRVVMAPLKDGRPAGALCFALKEDGTIAAPNDGGCPGGPVRTRWEENGWLQNAAHLERHAASDETSDASATP